MVAITRRPRARLIADTAVILTGFMLLGLAIWPGSPTASQEVAAVTTRPDFLWLALALGGGLAIAAVLVGQSWARHSLSRGLLLAAAIVLVGTLLIFRDFSARALLMLLLPALVFLAALTAFGPMPAPEEGT